MGNDIGEALEFLVDLLEFLGAVGQRFLGALAFGDLLGQLPGAFLDLLFQGVVGALQGLLATLAADDAGQHVGDGGDEPLLRRVPLVIRRDIEVEHPQRFLVAADRHAVMTVLRHVGEGDFVAGIHGAGKDGRPSLRRPAAQALAEGEFGAVADEVIRQVLFRHHFQDLFPFPDEEDGAPRFQLQIVTGKHQGQCPLHHGLQGNVLQRYAHQGGDDHLVVEVAAQLHGFALQRVARRDHLVGQAFKHVLQGDQLVAGGGDTVGVEHLAGEEGDPMRQPAKPTREHQ